MSKQISKKPVAIAMGAALAGGLMAVGTANAAQNPFGLTELDNGYMQVADHHMEGKCGGMPKSDEGKCGAKPKSEEGKCGGKPKADEGKCGAKPKAAEGKCGGKPKADEGKCGAKPKMKEGSCGENKCGANMK